MLPNRNLAVFYERRDDNDIRGVAPKPVREQVVARHHRVRSLGEPAELARRSFDQREPVASGLSGGVEPDRVVHVEHEPASSRHAPFEGEARQ